MLAKSFARIHWQNLVNFGVLPLTLRDPAVYDRLSPDDNLRFEQLRDQVRRSNQIRVQCREKDLTFEAEHQLSSRQIEAVLAGGLINLARQRLESEATTSSTAE